MRSITNIKIIIAFFVFLCLFSMIGCVSAAGLVVNSSVGVQGALNNDSSFDMIQTENMATYEGFNGLVDQGVQSSMELDTAAPVPVLCDPGYNAVNVESNKTITIEFNENISMGTGLIELKNSNGVLVPVTVSISGNVLTIAPVNLLTEDKYTLICHEGGVTDLAGNPVQEGTTYFTTGTSPIFTNVTPSVGETNVALNKNITITFNEPVKAGNSWFDLYYTNNGTNIQVPVNISINGNILTITPLSQLTENRYTLVGHEGGVTDLAGNPMPAGMMDFITGSSPIVTNVSPSVGETNVTLNRNITITFNEPVKAGSLWFELYCVNNEDYVLVPVNTSISENVVTIIPSNLLAGCRHILVGYDACVTDLAGNPVPSGMMEFTTVSDLIAPTVTANLASGVYNTTKIVTLTAIDNLDPNPSIYYTTNGSTPTTSSTMYINPINITGTTTLKFMTVDSAGNQANVTTEYYIFAPIGNINTGKGYSSIQAAIDDPLTLNEHVVLILNGTYTENIVVNKKLVIMSFNENVTVQPANSSNPVFTINSGGSSSVIQGFNIKGATGSCGICLNSSNNCNILENTIFSNYYGISIVNSDNITVYENIVLNNSYNGIYVSNSSASVNFNWINGNSKYGLYSTGNGTVNATNNWWGYNYLSVNGSSKSDIYGVANYSPYLVLTVNPTSYKVSEGKVYESIITADLNHNRNGEDTSPLGHVPDGIPVNFTTNRGTITGVVYTRNGKVESVLNLTSVPSGIAFIYVSVDRQSSSTSVDKIAKAVITVTSTAIDPNSGHWEFNYNKYLAFEELVWYEYGLDIEEYCLLMYGDPMAYNNPNLMPVLHDYINDPLSLTYEIPLNESVSWVSVLWKANIFNQFTEEVDLIVNGQVVANRTVINRAYLENSNKYGWNIFDDINKINWYLSDSTVPRTFLGGILNMTDFQLQNYTKSQLGELLISRFNSVWQYNSTELALINNYESFTDDVTVSMFYHGDEGKKITIVDPDTNNTIQLNFPGNHILRASDLIYHNGEYSYETTNNTYLYDGYEGVRSFSIATTKVTDEILRYWLDQKNNYDLSTNYTYTEGNVTYLYGQGPMKAAYGTFLTALLVQYCTDKAADGAAAKYNVTWDRTTPIVMSTVDDPNYNYLTGEMSFRFGMDVTGDPNNVKAFRAAVSSAFSPIEHWVYSALGFGGDPRGSVTLGLGDMLRDGEPLTIFESNGYTIIKGIDNNNFIVIDPETGIVRDIRLWLNSSLNISGTFCFNNPQTELAGDFGNSLLNNTEAIDRAMETGEAVATDFGQDDMGDAVLGLSSSMAISIGIAAMLLGGPPGWIIGAAIIIAGVAGSYYAADLDEGWTTSRWTDFGLNVGPSLIPFIGWEGGVVGRLGISYVTKAGVKKSVTTVAGNYEGYMITNLPKWGGGTFTGGYMSTAEYVKYGTTKRVIRTAFGDTEEEASKNALKYTVLPSRGSVIVNNYSPEIDYYGSVTYDNISDYLGTA